MKQFYYSIGQEIGLTHFSLVMLLSVFTLVAVLGG